MSSFSNDLTLVQLGIDTQQMFVVYIHADCFICKSEGFSTQSQLVVSFNNDSIIATLSVVYSDILKHCEASLSASAWQRLGVKVGDHIVLSHLTPVTSFRYVRSKLHGNALDAQAYDAIIKDIVDGKYSNVHLAGFISSCARDDFNVKEVVYLTQSMIKTGEQLRWDYPCVVDKHSVGGIPGNRTTPIVVAIVAAAGLIIPKTSSRAITSPAGTADTVETMTTVHLSSAEIQRVVAQEGGCMAWGGALGLSPADDLIIKVERVLDLDPQGQMIASVLSKKAAVGATHVVIDIPVGPTAKIRTDAMFQQLEKYFSLVGAAIGLHVLTLKTDGSQPVGKGIGPALEAKDVLAVLNNDVNAPQDLKNKAILLAGMLLEYGNKALPGEGKALATTLLESGAAFKKFLAICQAQGGFHEPCTASLTWDIVAPHSGIVMSVDNRNVSQIAKLAGAPLDPAAGIEFFAKIGTSVDKGELLYRIHAESKGALAYSLTYAQTIPDVIKMVV